MGEKIACYTKDDVLGPLPTQKAGVGISEVRSVCLALAETQDNMFQKAVC